MKRRWLATSALYISEMHFGPLWRPAEKSPAGLFFFVSNAAILCWV
jgi:hypothetical protein